MTTQNSESIESGVFENGLDSIRHALDHFSERNRVDGRSQHHDKWIVLSVYHAAESICNALLLQVEPDCNLFIKDNRTWFPSLKDTLQRLELEQNREHLTKAELQLISLLRHLPDMRHQFMHRVAPEHVDVSITAMCMIGLLKFIGSRYGKEPSEIVWQSPPIEGDVVAAIRYQRLDEYGKFVELFLQEKYPNCSLPQCPSCLVNAVVYSQCEACFEELASMTCSSCDNEVYYLPREHSLGNTEIECQNCNAILNI